MSPAQRYLATACAARLSRLREVLDEAEGAGLLLIAGVDSRRHELSIRTLRYLLLGASAPGDEGAIAPDSAIDEVMVLITPTATKLYCPLSSWPLLMPITSAWRDLEVYCLAEEAAYDDVDVVEAHKIESFVKMLGALAPPAAGGLVAVALPTDGASAAGEVERWPVVQAYALDEAGGKGFFSMRHRVVGVAAELACGPLCALDATSLRGLQALGLHRFAQQFAVASGLIDRAADGETRRRLTERQLNEPLATYFKHALLRELDEPAADAAAAERGPRVLFGPRTAAGAEAAAGGALRSAVAGRGEAPAAARSSLSTLTKASEAAGSGEPTHLTLELADARGPLGCARTWFVRAGAPARVWTQRTLGNGEVLEPLVDTADETAAAADAGAAGPSARALMRAYAGLADALDGAIGAYARVLGGAPAGLSLARALGEAREAAREAAERTLRARGLGADAADLLLTADAADLAGGAPAAGARAAHASRYVHCIRLALAAPPSVAAALRAGGHGAAAAAGPAGGVVLADSFALVAAPPAVGSATDGAGGLHPLLLTAQAVPRGLAWLADGAEGRLAERVRVPLDAVKPLQGNSAVQRLRCGEHYLLRGLLLAAAPARLLPPPGAHCLVSEVAGSASWFEEGFAFDSERLGPVVVPLQLAVEALVVYDPSADAPAALHGGSAFAAGGGAAGADGGAGGGAGGGGGGGAGGGAEEGLAWFGLGAGAHAAAEQAEAAADGGAELGCDAALVIVTLRADACAPPAPARVAGGGGDDGADGAPPAAAAAAAAAASAVLSYGPLGPWLAGGPGEAHARTFVLALARGSPLRKSLWQQCVPAWRAALARAGRKLTVADAPPAWLEQRRWPAASGAPAVRLGDEAAVPAGAPPPLPAAALRALEREALGVRPAAAAEPRADDASARDRGCVHVVVGSAGSGAAEVGASLRALSQRALRWHVLGPASAAERLPDCFQFDACALQHSLLAKRAAADAARGAGGVPERFMVVAPPLADPLAVVRAVAGLEPSRGPGWPFAVGAVVACVDAGHGGGGGAAELPPLLHAQLALATAVALVGCAARTSAYLGDAVGAALAAAADASALGAARGGAAAAAPPRWCAQSTVKALSERVRAINPAAELLLADGHAPRREGEVAAALGSRDGGWPFAAARARAQRERVMPGWALPALPAACALLSAPTGGCTLALVRLAPPCLLDESCLLKELARLLQPAWLPKPSLLQPPIQLGRHRQARETTTPTPPPPSAASRALQLRLSHADVCAYVATARADDDDAADADGGADDDGAVLLRASASPSALTVVSRAPAGRGARGCGTILLAGPCLTADGLRALVGRCVAALHPKQQPTELTDEQVRALDSLARATLPLPAAIFYTGSAYVDEDGAHAKWHPHLARLSDAKLAEQNAHVHAHNAAADVACAAAMAAVDVWCSP